MRLSVSEGGTAISEENGVNGKHLWSDLLREVEQKVTVKLPSEKALIVIGDDECGKTTLVARLQGVEEPKHGFTLEYTFLEIEDEDRDDRTKLGIWILDGDTAHSHLLKYALNDENFADCMAVIVVDMSKPWSIIDSLEEWANILEKHIKRLNIPMEDMTEYKESLVRHFREYVEPNPILAPCPSAIPAVSTPAAVPVASRRKGNPLHPATAALLSSTLTTGINEPGTVAPEAMSPVDTDATNAIARAATAAIDGPISPGALVNNLGIPLIVVVTKTDTMDVLEKEQQLNDEHFDFIQMHIRRFCLAYGAALFYVSVKEDKNCDLINRYIQHRIYGLPFTQAAYVVERDSIFVPTGWENQKKINILEQNLTQLRSGDAFNEVIHRPPPRKVALREPESHAEDEQAFFARMLTNIQRESATAAQRSQSKQGGTSSVYDPEAGHDHAGGSPVPRSAGSPRTPSTMRAKPSPTQTSSGGSGVGPGPGSSEGVLANFFNSLLSKRPPGPAVSSPTHAPTTAASGDKVAISQKDMHSELERLARSSREALEAAKLRKSPLPENSESAESPNNT